MKVFKKLLIVTMVAASLVAFAACADTQEGTNGDDNNQTSEEKTTLRIGTVSHAYTATEAGVSPLEDMGYEVEIVMFDDFITPDTALDEGSIDANLYQHLTFLNNYNEEHNTDLVFMEPIVYPFAGLYSVNYESLEDLMANGAGGTIAVASDASNQSLDLQNIEAAGLITLTDEEKELYSIADIVDNPYNFEFVYMDRNVMYNSRDEFAAYYGISNTVYEFGLDPTENLIYYVDYIDNALGLCVRAEDADTQWAQDLLTAYTSEEAKQYIRDNNGNAMLPME